MPSETCRQPFQIARSLFHMAPGAFKVAPEALEPWHVEAILQKAGFSDEDFKGQGGSSVVVAVAMFSSLAGLLMGLDIGYIAGVKSMRSFAHGLLDEEVLGDTQDGLITMIFGVGAAVAAFPPIMDSLVRCLGRRGAVLAGGATFCLGSLLQALAVDLSMLLVGRLVAGLAVGLLSGNAPVYTSEIAPPQIRGALIQLFQFAVTIGIMLAFLLALLLQDVEKPIGGWRWVIAAQFVPGLLLVLGALTMPGSPRYLVATGKPREALAMLLRLRAGDVRYELAQICQEHELEAAGTWRDFLSGDSRKLLVIGILIQLLQQLCGMNAFMYCGPLIFQKIFGDADVGRLFTVISGVVNIIATAPSLYLVDRCGRTTLMKWSALGMMMCSGCLALLGNFCYSGEPCYDWAEWTATVAIWCFILNFAFGWGGMPWVYCAEMFSQKHRTKGVAATTTANWIGNILIAFLPPVLFEHCGFNTFWLFVLTDSVCLFCAMSLPETKDKSLEEITEMFSSWLNSKD